MKLLILALISSSAVFAQNYQYIQGYQRHDGTYVQGHIRTTPDSNIYNNIRPVSNNHNNYNGQFYQAPTSIQTPDYSGYNGGVKIYR